uniref:BPL/LPL catalytic domain-containing protein n=1 Tax=Callorhinchus milii TaxID=7868 RepID=A0A4W3HIZ3_CALMI
MPKTERSYVFRPNQLKFWDICFFAPPQDIKLLFLKWLRDRLDVQHVLRSEKVSLKVTETQELGMEVTPSLLPVLTDTQGFRSEGFDPQVYWENLGTRLLGRVVLFTEVVATTMDLFGGWMLQLPEEVGLIAIAARQTQGKGRGRNAWISPKGSAMFTAHVCIPLHSELGRCIPFIQHLVPLAVVEAVLSLPGYEDIDLRVKWPNDIYYSGLMKLGGALVTSTLMGTTFHVLIGCGFNVSNSNPTICINDIIQRHNRENGTDLQPFRIDQLIARTLTQFEDFLHTFQTQGPNGVLPLYYKRWLHSGQQVRLWREDGPVAHIVGLDNCGFLQVQQEDDVIISVQPDGNSFDMLRNLIVTKQH